MEAEWIRCLRNRPDSQLIGDDAAILPSIASQRLVAVDMLMDGIHFLLDKTPPELIGRKALAVNLSDMAAMAGVPSEVLIALALPKNGIAKTGRLELAERLLAGMTPLLEKFELQIVGGDTNTWDGKLVLSITILGHSTARGTLCRNGGKPGDRLFVTGELGGSILGKHLTFEPRVQEALRLHENGGIHAAMDISDGLALDLHRLTTESHLGATLFSQQIPIANEAFVLAQKSGKTALEHALSDGEDFELLLAFDPNDAVYLREKQPLQASFGVTLYEVGILDTQPGLRLQWPNGRIETLAPQGFLHD